MQRLIPCAVTVEFARGNGSVWTAKLEVEVLERAEAYGLAVSAVESYIPNILQISEVVVGALDQSRTVEADDFSRFAEGEIVLAANPVMNMIDPLPAYTAWQLRKVESIPSGGPYLWADEDANIIFPCLTPYGVRKINILASAR